MPGFFQYMEQRQGVSLNDYLLELLPARDLSQPIFGVIYGSLVYVILRGLMSPAILLQFLGGYVAVRVARVFTLFLAPLEPLAGLAPLTDPGRFSFTEAGKSLRTCFFQAIRQQLF